LFSPILIFVPFFGPNISRLRLLAEADSLSSWTGLTSDSQIFKEGKISGAWQGASKGQEAVFKYAEPTDLSEVTQLSFWMYSETNNNAECVVRILAPGPNGAGDYWWYKFKTDFSGWKRIQILIVKMTKSRQPDIQKVTSVAFASSGWGAKPMETSVWKLDNVEFEVVENTSK
jgi:hypothetical protein